MSHTAVFMFPLLVLTRIAIVHSAASSHSSWTSSGESDYSYDNSQTHSYDHSDITEYSSIDGGQSSSLSTSPSTSFESTTAITVTTITPQPPPTTTTTTATTTTKHSTTSPGTTSDTTTKDSTTSPGITSDTTAKDSTTSPGTTSDTTTKDSTTSPGTTSDTTTKDSTTRPWTSFETTKPPGCIFKSVHYKTGERIKNACAILECDGATGQFNYLGIDDCTWCKAYLDPHIVTYNYHTWSYEYQKCGNYSLSQIGNTYNPPIAVYSTFEQCGDTDNVSCVDTITFKNDENTIITISYQENELKIQVNDEDYTVPSTSPTIVKVVDRVYPVVAWSNESCVFLQGSSGIFVEFCGNSDWSNQVYVWADSKVAGKLQGLCGNVNNDFNKSFINRDRTKTWPWQRDAPVEFLKSWLTLTTSTGSCGSGNDKIKRQAGNRCDADPAKKDEYNILCNTVVTNGYPDDGTEETQNVIRTLIDDCVFDLCHVDDPIAWLGAVEDTVKVQLNIKINTRSRKCESKWFGRCFGTQANLVGYPRCDSLIEDAPGCPTGESCCVDCSFQTEVCMRKWGKSVARNAVNFNSTSPCCIIAPGIHELRMGEARQGSGCSCCKYCRRKKFCRRNHGVCITDEDPVHNRTWCLSHSPYGRVKNRGCTGRGCHCCLWNKP